jgi:hypothetical protein
MIFLGNTNMDLRTDYLYIEGSSNTFTRQFQEIYRNVYQVDLVYAESNVLTANKSTVFDIEELRSPFTDSAVTAGANGSNIRGYFATIPPNGVSVGSIRYFQENADFKYSVQYKNPVSFDKFTIRVMDSAGTLGASVDNHKLLLRVHIGNPNMRPQMPVNRRDENNQIFEPESLGLLGN